MSALPRSAFALFPIFWGSDAHVNMELFDVPPRTLVNCPVSLAKCFAIRGMIFVGVELGHTCSGDNLIKSAASMGLPNLRNHIV